MRSASMCLSFMVIIGIAATIGLVLPVISIQAETLNPKVLPHAAKGKDEQANNAPVKVVLPRPGEKDRCPVCGMFVHKYPKWVAGIIFNDGSRYFHCCPKCMLYNFNHVVKYQPGKTRKDIATVWVTEYYSTRKMDAEDVVFVIGTKLVGPMGLDLIPIKGREAAQTFLMDYQGEKILLLEDITNEIIQDVRKGRLN